MKKTFLTILFACILFVGCSPDKQMQIQLYWMDQAVKLAERFGPKGQEVLAKIGSESGIPLSADGNIMTEIPTEPEEELSSDDAPAVQAKPATPKRGQTLEAMLFLSPTCPWCKKVKSEGFPQKFRNKFAGRVNLTEYEVGNNPENNALYSRMIKKHNLSGGVPLLIIGNSHIQGYSPDLLQLASDAAEKELKKGNIVTERDLAAKMPALLDVSMEDEEIKGPASAADRSVMKKMILAFQESNGAMIESIGYSFGPVVKNQAMALATRTEKSLRAAANKSATLATFKAQYEQISAQNNKEMNQLMLKNTDKLRNVR
ncbi:MAG: hypothetical protein J5601_05580 [Elusimicrobiaceae bacterium]|nr:hypothetical protein [Elusimicrobiaceae bacterium]